jgi:alkylation response protein AidB-like acyl-CoA dehydrogenase
MTSRLLPARHTDSTGGQKQEGITNFLVDTKLPGIEVGRSTHSVIGRSARRRSCTDVRVPATAVLGEVDRGWDAVDVASGTSAVLSAADWRRVRGLQCPVCKTRVQFGRPIGQFQAISHKLADMKVMLTCPGRSSTGLPGCSRARRRATMRRC